MTKYWCVNFDQECCLAHAVSRNLWMMQYQYEDDHGREFQGGRRKAATTSIWKRMKEVEVGDRFAAYLPKCRFFATGTVVPPRRPQTATDRIDSIEAYVERKRSHDIRRGFVYYNDAPVFYEDFTDQWRHPEDPDTRYAQRIDVDRWENQVPDGVVVAVLSKIPPYELQKAAFRISKRDFERIENKLAHHSRDDESHRSLGDAVAESAERSLAQKQGYVVDSKLRKSLENHAMAAATQYFELKGYVVEDHSQGHPYDLFCHGNRI